MKALGHGNLTESKPVNTKAIQELVALKDLKTGSDCKDSLALGGYFGLLTWRWQTVRKAKCSRCTFVQSERVQE